MLGFNRSNAIFQVDCSNSKSLIQLNLKFQNKKPTRRTILKQRILYYPLPEPISPREELYELF